MIGCINVVSLLEINVLPTSIDNVAATLKSDILAMLRQCSANLVTTLRESQKFSKPLTTSFKSCVSVISVNVSVFLRNLSFCKQ